MSCSMSFLSATVLPINHAIQPSLKVYMIPIVVVPYP